MRLLLATLTTILALQLTACADDLKLPQTCEDVLKADTCQTLRDSATALKVNVQLVNEAVKAAVEKKLTSFVDIIQSVKDTLVEKSINFQCIDVLSQEKCNEIVNLGLKVNVKAQDILTSIKEGVVLARGALNIEIEIFKHSMSKLLDKVQNLKCENMLSAATCAQITEFANKVNLKTKDVIASAKEALVNGAKNANEEYEKAKEYLTAKISCELSLNENICDKIRSMADKVSISLTKVDKFLKESIANGVIKVTDLYNAAIKFILSRWKDTFGHKMVKRDLFGFADKIKEKITKAVSKVLDTLKVTDQKIRGTIMKDMNMELVLGLPSNLKIRIQELMKKYDGNRMVKRDLFGMIVQKRSLGKSLVETLKKIHGKTKKVIEDLLKLSKAEFGKVKEFVKKHLSKINQDEVEKDFEFLDEMITTTVHDSFDNIIQDALNMADE